MTLMTGFLDRNETTALLMIFTQRWAVDLFMDEPAYYNKVDSMFLSHAARYSERSSDSGQNADGYLQNCFPSVRFHFILMLNVKC